MSNKMSDNEEDQLQTQPSETKTINNNSNGELLHENSLLSSSSATSQQPSSSSGYFTSSNNLRLHFSNINYVHKQSESNQITRKLQINCY